MRGGRTFDRMRFRLGKTLAEDYIHVVKALEIHFEYGRVILLFLTFIFGAGAFLRIE
jgi:hypothetical protein